VVAETACFNVSARPNQACSGRVAAPGSRKIDRCRVRFREI
jgi:hypothetical protein